MRKKILAILMATVTVGSLLSGCGGAKSGEATGKTESSKQESSDSEEPAEIVFAYMTQNNIPESSELERIQNLINDYTVDKINTKVKLVLFSNSDYMNQVNLMLASGEQIDLFQSLNTPHLKYISRLWEPLLRLKSSVMQKESGEARGVDWITLNFCS